MNKNKINLASANRGFTLIEIVTVVAIVGILTAIGVVSYTGIRQDRIKNALKNDITTGFQELKMAQALGGDSPNLTASPGNEITSRLMQSPAGKWCISAKHTKSGLTFHAIDAGAVQTGPCPNA